MRLHQLVIALALCVLALMAEGFYLANEIGEMSRSLRRSAHRLEMINAQLEVTNDQIRQATMVVDDLNFRLAENDLSE